jgi:predicted Zn-dependent protease
MRRALWVVMVGLCLGLAAGCENPLEIDRETEIEIGRQGGADLEAKYGVVEDQAQLARLGRIGKAVARVSREPDLPWSFKILNSKEVNALALPGGFVYVTKGMMDYVKSDGELAGVVAHEAVHVDHHHAKEGIEKAMTQALLVDLVTKKSSDSIRMAAQIALDLEMREGYREKEYEADRYGTLYEFKAGYGTSGLLNLLKYLHSKEGDPARITWLLQSHPPLSKRIQRVEEYIPTLTGG